MVIALPVGECRRTQLIDLAGQRSLTSGSARTKRRVPSAAGLVGHVPLASPRRLSRPRCATACSRSGAARIRLAAIRAANSSRSTSANACRVGMAEHQVLIELDPTLTVQIDVNSLPRSSAAGSRRRSSGRHLLMTDLGFTEQLGAFQRLNERERMRRSQQDVTTRLVRLGLDREARYRPYRSHTPPAGSPPRDNAQSRHGCPCHGHTRRPRAHPNHNVLAPARPKVDLAQHLRNAKRRTERSLR